MAHTLICWKCGASLAAITLPFRRLEVCDKCNAELHACRMCVEYDLSKAKHCREPIADEVRDKEHANFCDFYKPREHAYQPANADELGKARAGLDALFAGTPKPAGEPATNPATTSAEEARRKLEEMFKPKN
jgi:hypothetical protein